MHNNEIKKKLKLLSTNGVPALICDVLQLVHEEIEGNINDEDMQLEDYGRVSKEVIRIMRNKYKGLLKTEDVISRQSDLEDLIQFLKTIENNQ